MTKNSILLPEYSIYDHKGSSLHLPKNKQKIQKRKEELTCHSPSWGQTDTLGVLPSLLFLSWEEVARVDVEMQAAETAVASPKVLPGHNDQASDHCMTGTQTDHTVDTSSSTMVKLNLHSNSKILGQ